MGHVVQRRAPFFLYVAVTVTLAGCVVYFGWVRTWSSVYVPTMYPPFADMRVIQGAVRSVEHGYDPRIANVGDPWRRRFNYPMLWIAIGKALNFTNERWFIAICAALVLCFISLCRSRMSTPTTSKARVRRPSHGLRPGRCSPSSHELTFRGPTGEQRVPQPQHVPDHGMSVVDHHAGHAPRPEHAKHFPHRPRSVRRVVQHAPRIDEIERRVSKRELLRIRNPQIRVQAVERKASSGVLDRPLRRIDAGKRSWHVARPLEMVGSHAHTNFEHIQAAATLEPRELSDVGLEFVARTGLRLEAFTRAPTARIRFLAT